MKTKIIELSNNEFIQSRWKPRLGDITNKGVCGGWVGYGGISIKTQKESEQVKEVIRKREDIVWLPVGFNIETGSLQVDDLLAEILELNVPDYEGVRMFYKIWIQNMFVNIDWPKNNEFINQPEIILKLMWLNELINDKE